ncbi:hypothetical protein GCK72_018487 [Caenorhabditis remanei]|uniref:Uncharacterized protein n=1 Tax=Caenorhabditis remanei TaxID=31234 RepID=A0A6A5GB95_CAERE|nr:hypothetical protein GCK72_018487 [Caenorhabditis remanei]KAF1751933.1 hypothetical protein GCK72_018487 [Caenorhabditis remanei]
MVGSRFFASCLVLVLLGKLNCSGNNTDNGVQETDEENPVITREFPSKKKVYETTLKPNAVHVYYLKMNETYILDLIRVAAEITHPTLFGKEEDTILDVTVSNGRDNFVIKLPVVYPEGSLYTYGKLLNPLIPDDFGPKRSKKNKNSTETQNLIVTVQSRLRVDIDYKLFLTHLDRSQYDLKFKPGQSEKTLQNQKLTFVKPMGFFLDAKEQDVKSFHITVTSEDDICANVITVPANESIYDRPVDSDKADNQRVITFNRRADIFFSEKEIELFTSFRIFVFVSPVDSPCSLKTSRKTFNEQKKMTFEFKKLEPDSYFMPTLAMIAFFISPCLIVASILAVNVWRNRDPSNTSADLVSFESDEPNHPNPNTSDEQLVVMEEEEVNLQNHENLQNHVEAVSVKQDSLSLHGQVLRYPIAIILPVLMHTAVQFHNFTFSTMANRDEMCFHNSACSKPLGELRAWNNMISNIGYAIYGFVFILITMFRRWRHHSALVGTYECTLLDITIGVFMILQAIASATYHICPSDIAFQFDTPCIQVICGLLIIRQWLVRKESPSPAYTNMLLLAVVSLNFLISTLSKSSRVRYVIATIHFIAVATICLKKQKKMGSRKDAAKFMIFFAVANFILMTMYLTSSKIHLNQITTYCFILNCIVYLTYYAIMKAVSRESIGLKAKICGTLAIVGWITAGYFFFQDDTDWTRTAAASRALNKPCLLLDFFGSHDLWHIFGALAALFTFFSVSFVDDDLVNTPKSSINIF